MMGQICQHTRPWDGWMHKCITVPIYRSMEVWNYGSSETQEHGTEQSDGVNLYGRQGRQGPLGPLALSECPDAWSQGSLHGLGSTTYHKQEHVRME